MHHAVFDNSFVVTTELEPPDVDDENADLSDAESEFEDATSAKLLSKKQQVSPCITVGVCSNTVSLTCTSYIAFAIGKTILSSKSFIAMKFSCKKSDMIMCIPSNHGCIVSPCKLRFWLYLAQHATYEDPGESDEECIDAEPTEAGALSEDEGGREEPRQRVASHDNDESKIATCMVLTAMMRSIYEVFVCVCDHVISVYSIYGVILRKFDYLVSLCVN